MRRTGVFLLMLVLLFSVALSGCGQQKEEESIKYPERTINAIVGFSPGGPTDLIARGILPILQEKLGVGIGITNMPGAASATAASHVLDQPKDGYTLFFGSEIMSIWQTMGTMDLSPTRDFIPIKLVSQAIPVLAVPPDSKFNSVEDFIQYAKNNPGELRIGTAGPGTVPHISGLLLEKELGCKFTYVPHQGGAPAIAAVMGGQVSATIEMVQSMVQAHQAGKLKILASFTNEPIEGLDVPAIGKIFPELSAHLPYGPYFGLFAAKGTPEEIVKILEEKMDEAIRDERWDEYCKKLYLVKINYSGDEAVEFLDDWTSKSAWLLYDAGGAKNSPADFGIERPKK
ncbi:MAG: tripartite tricarboxylate transporter substrate binding protein [Firmicutes bacterium]|nr:tripartite tricarboxylate transporter substrate binding protein [Bacillota bacterium]